MCVFCKIINNEIPCYKVYEDDQVIAFLDISQVTHGHTLVVPKKHYENIFVLDEAIAGELYKAVVKVSNILKKGLNLTDLNIINNNGPVAGQTVNHYTFIWFQDILMTVLVFSSHQKKLIMINLLTF